MECSLLLPTEINSLGGKGKKGKIIIIIIIVLPISQSVNQSMCYKFIL